MIKQLVKEEFCLKCQGCCRFLEEQSAWLVGLLNEEISLLSKNQAGKDIVGANKKIKPVFSPKSNNYICPFLTLEKNTCQIYTVRPLECQLYPFLINSHQGSVWLAVDFNCPFAEANRQTEIFNEYVEYLAELLVSQPFKKILKENPQIMQSYPNVRNLRELVI